MSHSNSESDSQPNSSPRGQHEDANSSPLPGVNQTDASTADKAESPSDESSESAGRLAKLLSPVKSLFGRSNPDSNPTPFEDMADDIRQFISAEGISWKPNHTELGTICSRTYSVSGWAKEAQAHLIYQLYTDPQLVYNASLHYEPFDNQKAITRLAELEDQLADKAEGDFADYLPNIDAVRQTLNIIRDMKVGVENEGRKLYNISIYITVFAQDEDQLDKLDRRLREQVTTSGDLDIEVAREYPDEAHLSSSPLGYNAMADNREYATQLVLDKAAGMTFPLVDDTLVEPTGVIIGFNLANQTAVVLDIYERNNGYNKLVIGALGSGKSFSTGQYLIRHRIMHPEDNIIIIDPMGGYIGVNEAIGGEQITINGTETINPLEIKATSQEVLNEADQSDPYRMKLDEVRWFFQRFFESYDINIDGEAWAPLNTAIKKAYRDKGITSDPTTHSNESPTIRDVLDNLKDIAENAEEYAASRSPREIEKWEDHAASLLMDFQPFREGNELDNLVGHTDFEIDDSKPTYIDISAYDGKQDSQGLMMRILFSMLYEQVKDSDRRSIIAIDEAHKLIGDEQSADHWAELFRHSRHHDLSIHLISQELDDFFQSEDGEGANEAAKTMANLCTVRQIHRLNNVDRSLAKEGLNLTDDHIDFIENAVPGEEGRGYTTALLDVEDKGYYGLKVTATKDELSVVDYKPENQFSDPDVSVPENDTIKQALEARGKLKGNQPTPLEDELIREIVDKIPMDNLAPKVADLFIDRLIDDPETRFTEEDRRMLSHAIKTQDYITHQAPEFADAPLDETAGRIRVRAPDGADQDTPEQPPEREGAARTASSDLPWEKTGAPTQESDPLPEDTTTTEEPTPQETTTDGGTQASTETETNPDQDSPESPDTPVKKYPSPPESTPTLEKAASNGTGHSQVSTPAVGQRAATIGEVPTVEEAQPTPVPSPAENEDSATDTTGGDGSFDGDVSEFTAEITVGAKKLAESVPFWARKKLHAKALTQLSPSQIETLAAHLDSSGVDTRDLESREDVISTVHARNELEQDRATATIDPIQQIQTTLEGNTGDS
jgi:Cdc6-like AAA superfamily ATPase